jgi:glycosyltransferase involved in cell wall biosynthesis
MTKVQKWILVGIAVTIVSFLAYKWYTALREKHIVVVTPSYNNINHYQRNLESVFVQKNGDRPYGNWSLYYTDDCSADGTYEAVAQLVKEHGKEKQCTLIKNEVRKGAMGNDYAAIHSLPDDAIVVVLDGDDALAHEHVFEKINQLYQDPNVWLTYGQYQEYPSGKRGHCTPLPAEIINRNAVRKYPFVTSHLRTFYAGLFKKIRKQDLMHNGDFFQITSDLAFMFPMIEMAGMHARFVPEVLCIYNMDNPINDFKKDIHGLLAMERVIRTKRPYAPLSSLA